MNRKIAAYNEGVLNLLESGASVDKSNEIMSHFVDVCPKCDRIVFDSPDAAAQFVGGLRAVDRTEMCRDGSGVQYSVLWYTGGRGGCGGGVRESCSESVDGWENF